MNMKTASVLGVSGPGGRGPSNTFNIAWEGNVKSWSLLDLPGTSMPLVCSAIEEVINRDAGAAFLLPSLSRTCRFEVGLNRVARDLTILKFQEGRYSGVFKVTAKVDMPGQGYKSFSFCLNASRTSEFNALQTDIHRLLDFLRGINPRFVVEPFYLETGSFSQGGRRGEVAVHSSEWLEGYTEVNMFNSGEDLPGLEAVGWRRVKLNNPFFHGEGTIEDDSLADAIAEEMVKILTIYFDSKTARAIWNYGINAGDFVCRIKADGTPDLKLITARAIRDYPAHDKEHVKAYGFLDELFYHRENSSHHQNPLDPQSVMRYLIYPFTPMDVCRGLKKGLVEKYGADEAHTKLLYWLGTYLIISQMVIQSAGGYRDNAHQFRDFLVRNDITRFLASEG
jgi:hypothetical protein